MMQDIVLSIAIPTWNRVNCLREALESIYCSIPENFFDQIEVLICDNGSDDATPELALDFSKKYRNFKSYRNESNIGPEENFYHTTLLASGKYVWLFGDDDKMESYAIEKIFDLFEKDYDYILLNYSIWSQDFTQLKGISFYNEKESQLFIDPKVVLAKFSGSLGFISGIIFKKYKFELVEKEKYDHFKTVRFSFLYAMYRGLFEQSRLYYLADTLVLYRGENTRDFNFKIWVECFVMGMQSIFHEMKHHGASNASVRAAANKIMTLWGLGCLLSAKNQRQLGFSDFKLLYQASKNLWSFWFLVVPIMITPRFILVGMNKLRKFIKSLF